MAGLMSDQLAEERKLGGLELDAQARADRRAKIAAKSRMPGNAAADKTKKMSTSDAMKARSSLKPGEGVRKLFGGPPGAATTRKPLPQSGQAKPESVPAKKADKPSNKPVSSKPAKKKGSAGAASNRDIPGRSKITYSDGKVWDSTKDKGPAPLPSSGKKELGMPHKIHPDRPASKPRVGPGGGADNVLLSQRGASRLRRFANRNK